MAAEVEQVVDPVMGGEEALCLARRLEALHLPFSPSCRLVGVLRRVVETLVLPVLDAGHDLPFRRRVALQLLRDHHPGSPALFLQQLAQQAESGRLVTPALHQDVEHDAVLVDGAPKPLLLARDRHHHLVAVPLVSRRRQPAPDLVGERLPELQSLLPHRLMADEDAACGQQLIHHAQAQGKTKIELHRVADDLGWIAIASVARAGRCRHPARLPQISHISQGGRPTS